MRSLLLVLVPVLMLPSTGCRAPAGSAVQRSSVDLVDVTALRPCAQVIGAVQEAGAPQLACLEVSVDPRGDARARPACVARSCRYMAFPNAYGRAKCTKRLYRTSPLAAVADKRCGRFIMGPGTWHDTPEALAKSLQAGSEPGMPDVARVSAPGDTPADTVLKLLTIALDNLARVELRIVTEAPQDEAGRRAEECLRSGLAKAGTSMVLLRVDRSASWTALQRVLSGCMKARVDKLAIIVVSDGQEVALGRTEAAAETNALALVPAEWPDDTPMDAVSDIPLGQPPKPPGPKDDLRETVPGE